MKMNIGSFASLTGVSVRTLHYYDEIDLLKPDFTDEENGYRYYGEKAILRMQEILFYRELDFPLKTVRDIISSPDYDKKQALSAQRELLLIKKRRLERIIEAIDSLEKGERNMNFDAFDNRELESRREDYKREAKQRWGETDAYRESEKNTADWSAEKWKSFALGMDEILEAFVKTRLAGVSARDEAVISLVQRLKDFITETQYTCTDEILLGLGEMYVSDERFKRNIDKHGEATAEYIRQAIRYYCKK